MKAQLSKAVLLLAALMVHGTAPAEGDIRLSVPLPEPPPPLVTDEARGLEPTLGLPPPEPPPVAVVIPPPDPPPANPAIALPAPPPPPALAVTPPPPPAAPPAMPAEALEAALKAAVARDRLSAADAEAVLARYAARGHAPLWLDPSGSGWTARGLALRAALEAADQEGMDPSRYRTVSRFIGAGEPQWPALAAAEAEMTLAALRYAREAAAGRVRPSAVHPLITPDLKPPTAGEVLDALLAAADPGAALRSFQPPHPQFARLKEALARARAARPAVASGERIPDGPPLRVGMRDPRVPLIRARLGLGYDGTAVYDRRLSIRIAALQRESGLPVNGMFTGETRRALLGEAPTAEEAEIIANMEFWRWLPRDLGREHIFVNTPGYSLQVLRDGAVIHEARIIVGKDETQTPVFSDEMDHIVVNPSWYIPPGILKREPKYLDPAYAIPRGYELRTDRNGVTTVRVPPSSSNALGYVKFMFPNRHAVYLHDTPNRRLFNASVRTLSNGCVRVENPMRLAALLFADQGFTEERFRRMQGGPERRMNLPRKWPIHLAYLTMTVAEDGTIARHPDVYGHVRTLRRLLGLS